jgi:DNA-binding response OmpR family regulator
VTILIVEDNALLAKHLARLFAARGLTTSVAQTLAAAADFLLYKAFDGICLDLQLPDGLGMDLLRSIKQGPHRNVPVVIITGSGNDADRQTAEKLGAAGFLTKPFPLADLAKLLENAMERAA